MKKHTLSRSMILSAHNIVVGKSANGYQLKFDIYGIEDQLYVHYHIPTTKVDTNVEVNFGIESIKTRAEVEANLALYVVGMIKNQSGLDEGYPEILKEFYDQVSKDLNSQ